MRTLVRSTAPHAARWRPRRPSVGTVVIALLSLAGLVLLLYPGTAAWISQYRQSLNIIDYDAAVSTAGPATLHEELELARAYNATLAGRAVVGAGSNVPVSLDSAGAGALSYERLLASDSEGIMGRIQIPAIDVDLPIAHGTSEATLLKSVGHLEGTSLPVGGIGSRAVLTAHRGLASARLFTDLDQVREGDRFTLAVAGEVFTYEVIRTQVVAPTDTETLLPEPDRDLVTLVTCTPLGVNTHRILVTGERIEPTPAADIAAASAPPEVPRFPWWAVGLGGGLLAIGAFVWTDGFRGGVRPGGEGDPGAEGSL